MPEEGPRYSSSCWHWLVYSALSTSALSYNRETSQSSADTIPAPLYLHYCPGMDTAQGSRTDSCCKKMRENAVQKGCAKSLHLHGIIEQSDELPRPLQLHCCTGTQIRNPRVLRCHSRCHKRTGSARKTVLGQLDGDGVLGQLLSLSNRLCQACL